MATPDALLAKVYEVRLPSGQDVAVVQQAARRFSRLDLERETC